MAERQSAQMSKITNVGLTRSSTWCLIALSGVARGGFGGFKRRPLWKVVFFTA